VLVAHARITFVQADDLGLLHLGNFLNRSMVGALMIFVVFDVSFERILHQNLNFA